VAGTFEVHGGLLCRVMLSAFGAAMSKKSTPRTPRNAEEKVNLKIRK